MFIYSLYEVTGQLASAPKQSVIPRHVTLEKNTRATRDIINADLPNTHFIMIS